MSESKKKPLSRLTVPQYVHCCDWLRDNWAKIEEQRPSRFQLCGMMREALGFRIPVSSLMKALEAIDKTMPVAPVKPLVDDNGFLRKTDRVRILCRVVRELYTRLGETPPPVLDKLIVGYSAIRQDKELDEVEPAAKSQAAAGTKALKELAEAVRDYETGHDEAESRKAAAKEQQPTPATSPELERAKEKLQRLSKQLKNNDNLSKQSLLRQLDVRSLNALKKANELDNQLVLALSSGVVVTERHLRGGL